MIKKYLKSFLLLVSFLTLPGGCTLLENNIGSNCYCTQEFAIDQVTIVDSAEVPVDSLKITVKDKAGNILDIKQNSFAYMPGNYIVLHDGSLNLLCGQILPQRFDFSATDGKKIVSARYYFLTDDCCCHIQKVSGPDTLVLR